MSFAARESDIEGAQGTKEALEAAHNEFAAARREGDLTRMSELQYGVIPDLEKRIAEAPDDPRQSVVTGQGYGRRNR